jgi:hypothetical protein
MSVASLLSRRPSFGPGVPGATPRRGALTGSRGLISGCMRRVCSGGAPTPSAFAGGSGSLRRIDQRYRASSGAGRDGRRAGCSHLYLSGSSDRVSFGDPPIGPFCGGPGIAARPPPDPPIGHCSSRLRSCTASKIQPALAWIRRCSRAPRHRGSPQHARCIAGKGGFSGAGARRSPGRSRRSRSHRQWRRRGQQRLLDGDACDVGEHARACGRTCRASRPRCRAGSAASPRGSPPTPPGGRMG